MMDAKEARDLLILESAGAARERKEIQANAMAIMALDKRIPKVPHEKSTGRRDYIYTCPECSCGIAGPEAWSHKPFCEFCGQAIDWKDER